MSQLDRKRIATPIAKPSQNIASDSLSLRGQPQNVLTTSVETSRPIVTFVTRGILALESIPNSSDKVTTSAGERWAPIPGYEATYLISTRGRVWSTPRPRTPGGLIRSSPDRYGYPRATLVQNGKQRKVRVHLLVMSAFVGPTPTGMEIRHLDGNAGNPALQNLSFGTHVENMADMVRHGRSSRRSICKRGHLRVPGNLGAPNSGGGRPCLACRREVRRAKSE